MSIVRTLRAALGPYLLTPLRAITSSSRAQGLEDFIAEPVKEGEKVTAGERMVKLPYTYIPSSLSPLHSLHIA